MSDDQPKQRDFDGQMIYCWIVRTACGRKFRTWAPSMEDAREKIASKGFAVKSAAPAKPLV